MLYAFGFVAGKIMCGVSWRVLSDELWKSEICAGGVKQQTTTQIGIVLNYKITLSAPVRLPKLFTS